MKRFWVGGWTACVLSTAAIAHHSTAEFDYTKQVTVQGVVEEIQWTNPHCYATIVETADPNKKYRLEFGTPGILVRMGWLMSSLKRGDEAAFTFSPMRSSPTGGALISAVTGDGHTLHAPIYYIISKQAPPGGAPPPEAAPAAGAVQPQ